MIVLIPKADRQIAALHRIQAASELLCMAGRVGSVAMNACACLDIASPHI